MIPLGSSKPYSMKRIIPLLSFIIVGLMSCQTNQNSNTDLHSSNQATSSLKVADGLEATLFASEPMIVNPTNIDIDTRGRVWVCEGFNYRLDLNPTNPHKAEGDRIVILEDTDGDGKADKHKVFYQGNDINSALGICVFGNKVIVSRSPDVFVFTDEDGDDIPDSKEILYTGIGGEEHDHGMHAFVMGPDGRLYFNFGNAGRQLKDKDGHVLTDIHGNEISEEGPFQEGMVFRTNADFSGLEVLGNNFRNNYEVAVDAFGTIWQSDNDDDGNKGTRINFVMEYGNYGYKDEYTKAGWRKYRTGMSDDISLRHWHLNDPGVVPNLLQTYAGSPTGITVYEGDLLPDVFQNQMIHCDAGPNIVRSYPVTPQGAGYTAKIVNLVDGTTDNWFRPSDVCAAPDGSVFIADWYDPGVGGHQMGDTARGRIFRIAPPKTPYKPAKPDFNTPEGATKALVSPNASIRGSAWMALEKMGTNAETALKSLWESENPRHRARALWLLARLPGTGSSYVDQALSDENSDIRITGLRVARQLNQALIPRLTKMAEDESPQVRREVAIAIRHLDPVDTEDIWVSLAESYPHGDRWYLEALGIASDLNPEIFFSAWRKQVGNEWNTPSGRDIVWRVRSKSAVPLLASLIQDSGSTQEMAKYFRALDFHVDGSKNQFLAAMLGGDRPDQTEMDYLLLNHMDVEFVQKSTQAKKAMGPIIEKIKGTEEYLRLVERLQLKDQHTYLLQMALDDPTSQLGNQAIDILQDMNQIGLFEQKLLEGNEAEISTVLTALGQAQGSEARNLLEGIVKDEARPMHIRRLAIQNLTSGWSGENRMIELLDENTLPDELAKAGAIKLLSAWRGKYREKAAEFLNLSDEGNTLPPINELVATTGNENAGKVVFKQNCSSCHQINGEGIDFGPKLSEIGSKLSKEAMYGSIMNPSAGISFGYEGYLFSTNDGNKVAGFIVSETGDEIDVRMAGGVTRTLKKSEISEQVLLENSLMTPDLHKVMTQEQLVDLVEYLSNLKKPTEMASAD